LFIIYIYGFGEFRHVVDIDGSGLTLEFVLKNMEPRVLKSEELGSEPDQRFYQIFLKIKSLKPNQRSIKIIFFIKINIKTWTKGSLEK
jgi:hypothetical protein